MAKKIPQSTERYENKKKRKKKGKKVSTVMINESDMNFLTDPEVATVLCGKLPRVGLGGWNQTAPLYTSIKALISKGHFEVGAMIEMSGVRGTISCIHSTSSEYYDFHIAHPVNLATGNPVVGGKCTRDSAHLQVFGSGASYYYLCPSDRATIGYYGKATGFSSPSKPIPAPPPVSMRMSSAEFKMRPECRVGARVIYHDRGGPIEGTIRCVHPINDPGSGFSEMYFYIGDAKHKGGFYASGSRCKKHSAEHSWVIANSESGDIEYLGNDTDTDVEKAAEFVKNKVAVFQPGDSISAYISGLIDTPGIDEKRRKWLKTFRNCVLPTSVNELIEEALTIILCKDKFDEWGIHEHFEKGVTNSILLFGPPGTGKSMIAESFAAVLGKNLLKIDPAIIQSQIPGQAERNIKDAFKKAHDENCVIMFDECDSLLYDREVVGMIMGAQINCLLTEIERFDGVCILTTNRLGSLDPALQRRIIAKIELPLPSYEARIQIWRNLLPPKMPVEELSFEWLGKQALSGGEIKNAILLAVRKAIAKNEKAVTMLHFRAAILSIMESSNDFQKKKPIAMRFNRQELVQQ